MIYGHVKFFFLRGRGGGSCSKAILCMGQCVFKKALYVRWRHFTTTTRILFVFPFMVIPASFNLHMKAKLEGFWQWHMQPNLAQFLHETWKKFHVILPVKYARKHCSYIKMKAVRSVVLELSHRSSLRRSKSLYMQLSYKL